MHASEASLRNEGLEKMATVKNVLKVTLLGAMGVSTLNANAQVETFQTTTKTPITGESYFKYDIYQSEMNVKPYLTCVTEKNCPQRTTKTLIVKPPIQPAPIVEPVEKNYAQPLSGVYFAFASAKLSVFEKSHLKNMFADIRTKKVVHLRAYTDPIGGVDSTYNRKLAKERAIQVLKYLKKLGIKGQIHTEYNPPCCIQQGVTATSSDEERKRMRVVEIS